MLSNDLELKERIEQALHDDTRVDLNEIDVRVENGVVHLEGAVDSAAERKAVKEDVETIPGVDQVVDYLKLRNFIERSDEELREAVKQDLMRDPYVDASGIQIQAHDGKIRLEGHVSTFAEKHSAENVVWWTPGVVDVVSHIQAEEADIDENEPAW